MQHVLDIVRRSFLWSNLWDVSERIELDGLVAGIVAGHVALAAVDAHLGVDQGHNMLPENCTFYQLFGNNRSCFIIV
jgi:hypothetical protein